VPSFLGGSGGGNSYGGNSYGGSSNTCSDVRETTVNIFLLVLSITYCSFFNFKILLTAGSCWR